MNKWILAAIAAAGLLSAEASAQGPPPGTVVDGGSYAGYGPPGGAAGYGYNAGNAHFPGTGKFWSRSFFGGKFSSSGNLTRMPTLPVFMAAPWYNYWPYDGHFQTVAPISAGAFYPPPAYTGNPFMPAAPLGYVPGAPVQPYPMAAPPKK
jgi:hypothetical protein